MNGANAVLFFNINLMKYAVLYYYVQMYELCLVYDAELFCVGFLVGPLV